jgi:hypothetical protein
MNTLDDGSKASNPSTEDSTHRSPLNAPTATTGRNGLQQFHQRVMQNGGVFEAAIIRPEHLLSMLSSEHDERTLWALTQWLAMVRGDSRELCLTCEHEFTPHNAPTAFCVSKTLNREPMLLITGVCTRCGSKCDEDLLDVARWRFCEMGMVREDPR